MNGCNLNYFDMKTLILIRHSKSSWEQGVDDIKRPLNERGFADAPLVAEAFKGHDFQPDAIYCSPAKRALTTCKLFMEALDVSEELLHIEKELYDFGGGQVRRFIKSMNDDFDKVMIFGHNHAFTTMANNLGNVHIDNLPTTGLVRIDFDADNWQDVEQGITKLVIKPKDLK